MTLACPLMSGRHRQADIAMSPPLARTMLQTIQTPTVLEMVRVPLPSCWVLTAALLMAAVVLRVAQQAIQMTH